MLPIDPRIGATGGLAVRKCPRLVIGGEWVEPVAVNGVTG
jgi:hypothetical protein